MALFRSDPPAPDATPAGPASSTPRPAGRVAGTPANPAEQHTIVGAATTIEGALRATGNLNVSGTVVGNVAVEGRTMVMPGGVVDGEVASTTAEVAGRITGTLTVRDRLVLRPTAVIDGDIRAGTLVIEEGAVFNGRCEMGAATRSDAPRPSEAKPEARSAVRPLPAEGRPDALPGVSPATA